MKGRSRARVLAVLGGVLSLAAADRNPKVAPRPSPSDTVLRVSAWKPTLPPRPVRLRDPFAPLLSARKTGPQQAQPRPPGKAGLAVSELVVQGVVFGPTGAVAVVASPQGRVYFLHPGDDLFDGRVLDINDHGVEFVARTVDAAGRISWHRVLRRVESARGSVP